MIGFKTNLVREVQFNGDIVAVKMDAHGVTMWPKGTRHREIYRSWQWIYRHIGDDDRRQLAEANGLTKKAKKPKLANRGKL